MNDRMWYRHPADVWKQGLPIGNGILGGMVLGGADEERIALNHEWLWRATNRHRTTEPKHERLEEIRRLFFKEKTFEAATLANEVLGGPGGVSGRPNRVDPYQPAGDLHITMPKGEITDYSRELNLKTGIVTVRFLCNGKQVQREVFAHASLPVLCMRITSECDTQPGILLSLSRIDDPECDLTELSTHEGMELTGNFPEGSEFTVQARVIPEEGQTCAPAEGASYQICSPGETLVVLTIGVSHDGESADVKAEGQFDDVPTTWDELLAGHQEAYDRLYGCVSLNLGDDRSDIPTDERLEKLRTGKTDNGLMELYFNFGRYLLFSSSRSSGVPANLQGIWNEELKPPWDCDLHHDVNIQMNYWPAEVCGLGDCTGALFEHMERFIPHAKEMARNLYDCDGVFFPIQTDPWGRATPESRGWDVWTGAAAWLAQHMWWRYEYSHDVEFLSKRAYPFFREVAAFYRSYLVEDENGQLVTVPSQSPENRFVGGTSPVSLCIGATMDFELIRDVLVHAISASEILGVNEDDRAVWQDILDRIPPLKIGKHGQLQEWLEDYEEEEPAHRHISHLVGLFPGDNLTLENEPEMTAAARTSLERRLAHGGGHTGWSRAWTVCCWARLREGDKAYEHLRHLITDFATNSMLDLHPPEVFQIDGNFGGTAGIAEMLMQSHRGLIRFLPALPSAWESGKVTGLRARGGFIVDIVWRRGRVQGVMIQSTLGGPCAIQIDPDRVPEVNFGSCGVAAEIETPSPDVIVIPSEAGQVFSLYY